MSAKSTATGANAVGTDDAFNPYLAHLYPKDKQTAKDPLHGLIPRRVTADQAVKVMVGLDLFLRGNSRRELTLTVSEGWGDQSLYEEAVVPSIQENP